MMQWSNLTKCGLFFNIFFPAVHTLLPLVLQHLDSCGIEVLIMILGKVLNCRYDLIIGLTLLPSRVFFHVGEQKTVRWCQIRRIWMVSNQFKDNHAQQPLQPQTCVKEHRTGETRLLSSVFQAISEMSLNQYYFSNPELLIQLGFIWKETMQFVSRKGEFNSCQVSLLCHNSFLVSLLSFQSFFSPVAICAF